MGIATVIEDGRIGERMALRLNLLEKKVLSKNYVFYVLYSLELPFKSRKIKISVVTGINTLYVDGSVS